MQVGPEGAGLVHRIKMCAGNAAKLDTGPLSVDAEGVTAETEAEAGTTDGEATRGRDAGPLKDTNREEAAGVTQERLNGEKEDASGANNEDTLRLFALNEEVVEISETDMMIDAETMQEIADGSVAMAAETWAAKEITVVRVVATYPAVGHHTETDVGSETTQTGSPETETTIVLETEVLLVGMNAIAAEAPLTTTSERVACTK
jgi:hypothetical protein